MSSLVFWGNPERFIARLILLFCCLFIETAIGKDKPDVDGESRVPRSELTLLAYNIMQLPHQSWGQYERAERLNDALLGLDINPDVMVFSEVFTDHAYTQLQKLTGYEYITPVLGKVCCCSADGGWDSVSGNCSTRYGVYRGGIVIVSRYPIKSQHAYVFNTTQYRTYDYYANKGAVYVEIEIAGYRYHIVGTHTQADHTGFDAEESHQVRVEQLKEIRQWIDGFGISEDQPVIVCGDLNIPHDDTRLKQLFEETLGAVCKLEETANSDYVHSYSESNWLTRGYLDYVKFPERKGYNKTLDYIVSLTGYLQPSYPATQSVVYPKATSRWNWPYLEGVWKDGEKYLSRWSWRYIRGTWTEEGNCFLHDGHTDEISDHYPVYIRLPYQ